VAAAMGSEMIFRALRDWVVETDLGSPVGDQVVDPVVLESLVTLVDEEGLGLAVGHILPPFPVVGQDLVGLIVEVDHAVGSLGPGFETDGAVEPIDVVHVDAHQLVPTDAGLCKQQNDSLVPWVGYRVDLD